MNVYIPSHPKGNYATLHWMAPPWLRLHLSDGVENRLFHPIAEFLLGACMLVPPADGQGFLVRCRRAGHRLSIHIVASKWLSGGELESALALMARACCDIVTVHETQRICHVVA